jgi:hypothetical protein
MPWPAGKFRLTSVSSWKFRTHLLWSHPLHPPCTIMPHPAFMLCSRLAFRLPASSSSSHTGLRRLHTTPVRLATPPVVPKNAPKLPRPSATARPSNSGGDTSSSLNWRPIKSRQKNVIAEERILFVRPFEVGHMGKSRWALPVFGLALGTYGTGFALWEFYQSQQAPDIRCVPALRARSLGERGTARADR